MTNMTKYSSRKARLNNIMIGLVLSGCAVSSVSAQNNDPWETGHGLTNVQIDSTKERFNTYENKTEKLLPISAYFSNWSSYHQGFKPSIESLSKYDKIILSFFGVCGTEVGDPSNTSAIDSLIAVCTNTPLPGGSATFGESFKGQKFELRSTDPGADFMKSFPSAGIQSNWSYTRLDPNPGGMMGVLKKLNQEKGTNIAISVFGWSLSNIASELVSTKNNRTIFINSVLQYLDAYPFISQIDIDWEYPGIKGADLNNFDPENDAHNYKLLIQELRASFDNKGHQDVKIGIASGAPQDKIDAAKLKDLENAGVDTIHLMTYDFFGETWAEGLAHHTNLMTNENSVWSADASIRYMIDVLGLNSKTIQIGYANYSRNALNAKIEQFSPLKGTFTKNVSNEPVMGTWEGAVTGIEDILTHYLKADETGLTTLNNYHLYTDEQANADYLYKKENGIFISLDTPRTVFAKAQYAIKNNLGGIFNWMGDNDEGLMLNAAREGLEYKLVTSNIDMDKIINTCGENVTQASCDNLTHLNDGVEVNAGPDVESVFAMGSKYQLEGTVTHDDRIKKTTWKVGNVTGTQKGNVVIAHTHKLSTPFEVSLSAPPTKDITITFKLKIELNDGTTKTDTVKYTLKKEADSVPEINGIDYPAVYNINEGSLSFKARASDSKDSELAYSWAVTHSNYAIAFDNALVNPAYIDLTTLVNKPEYQFNVNLTVSNDDGKSASDAVTVTVKGDEDANNAPEAAFVIATQKPTVGQAVVLQSTSKDELVDELKLKWTVTMNGQSVPVESDSASYNFVPQEAGEYTVQLEVTDVFSVINTAAEQSITVEEAGIPVDYVWPDGKGSYIDGTIVDFKTTGEGVWQCYGAWAAQCNSDTFAPGISTNPTWISQQWKKIN